MDEPPATELPVSPNGVVDTREDLKRKRPARLRKVHARNAWTCAECRTPKTGNTDYFMDADRVGDARHRFCPDCVQKFNPEALVSTVREMVDSGPRQVVRVTREARLDIGVVLGRFTASFTMRFER